LFTGDPGFLKCFNEIISIAWKKDNREPSFSLYDPQILVFVRQDLFPLLHPEILDGLYSLKGYPVLHYSSPFSSLLLKK